jgi:S1-C subfamily serine protease
MDHIYQDGALWLRAQAPGQIAVAVSVSSDDRFIAVQLAVTNHSAQPIDVLPGSFSATLNQPQVLPLANVAPEDTQGLVVLRASTVQPGQELRGTVYFRQERVCVGGAACRVLLTAPIGETTFVFPLTIGRPPTNAGEGAPTAPGTGQAQNAMSGTGFFFSSDGYLLTNLHVVTGCQTASFKIRGIAASAPVLFSDSTDDLAVLKLEGHQTPLLAFREDQRLKLGENIIALGFPLTGVVASSLNLTTGTISALAGLGEDTRMIQFTAPVQPGNSGGPLLDQSGHVVGIVTGKLSPLWTAVHLGDIPQNVNFAIKASVVRAFLESKGIDYTTAPAVANVETPSIGEQAKDAVVSITCVPGSTGPSAGGNSATGSPGRAATHRPIGRLSDIKTIAFSSFGNSVSADLVREKISNRLVKSGRLTFVEDPQQADAVLTGVLGVDVYGRADTAAFKLVTWDGRIIWVGEDTVQFRWRTGSASSHVADKVANGLLKALEADVKAR